MRVVVFGKATEASEKGEPPTTEAFAAMDRFTEELVKAGVFVAAAPPHAGQERDRSSAVLRSGGSGRVYDARGTLGTPRRSAREARRRLTAAAGA